MINKIKKLSTLKKIILIVIILAFCTGAFFLVRHFIKKDCNDDVVYNSELPNYDVTEKKPVLYLYPKKDNTKITVTFKHPEKLKTTYPKYKDKWVVTANKNGTLTDKKGNTYYALFWEEKGNSDIDFSKGYYVTKDDALTFLEDKLKYIGLTDRERDEFIMYWLPVLEANGKSIVYFEQTKEREDYNKIYIEPKPDSMLRLAIHIKKVDKKPKNLEKQRLDHFNRRGFAAVEWGGIIHN